MYFHFHDLCGELPWNCLHANLQCREQLQLLWNTGPLLGSSRARVVLLRQLLRHNGECDDLSSRYQQVSMVSGVAVLHAAVGSLWNQLHDLINP